MKNLFFSKTHLISLILLGISMSFISCDSWPLKDFIDEETKSYCYFENGISYTYKDSVSETLEDITINDDWYISEQGDYHHAGQIMYTNIMKNNEAIGVIMIEAIKFKSHCSDEDISFSKTDVTNYMPTRVKGVADLINCFFI
jgi:maltodextrin utilization protein YvdJ